MTRDEFIAGYCERSGVTWEWLSQRYAALPCACGEKGCDGWAMVGHPMIEHHMQFYAPQSDADDPLVQHVLNNPRPIAEIRADIAAVRDRIAGPEGGSDA